MNKSKNKNFFSWYYTDGIHEFLEIWKNYLFFILYHFNVKGLSLTLFSPWKRDVEIKNWRGWNPSRAIKRFLDNLISRLIGSILRLAVVLSGIILLLLTFLIGLLLILVWLTFPLFLLYFLYRAISGSILFTVGIGFLISYLGVIISTYFIDIKIPYTEMDLRTLYASKIFERIANRIGLTKKDFPKKAIKKKEELLSLLNELSLSEDDFDHIIKLETLRAENERMEKAFWRKENLLKKGKIGEQWKYAYTVKLDKYSIDLSKADSSAYRDEKLIGRTNEKNLLRLILKRPDQNSVLLVGGAGIGKETMIHDLAREIREKEIAGSGIAEKRIILFDLSRAISDAINNGEDVEGYIKNIFLEAAYAGNIILVVEHFEQFLGKNNSPYHPDLSPVLSDFLEIPTFQIIGITSTKQYHTVVSDHGEVSKHFQVIEVSEPTEHESLEILYSILKKYETRRVLFTYKSLITSIKESEKYKWEVPLPERAIDLAMDSMTYWDNKGKGSFITKNTVFEFIEMETGVSRGEIGTKERKKLLNLENEMHKYVIGQEEAIRQVSEAMRRARSGISNSKKPVGSFLFLGPTGVGKTETAKALARAYFGDSDKMIRLDMSEYQSPQSINRMIGSIETGKRGQLTDSIKDNPHSLLLLDEIEKAYPNLLDIFLQILDEGFVTDAYGDKINFRNTIIIATSNLGSQIIREGLERKSTPEEIKEAVIENTISSGSLRTEFLNRFDDIVYFSPLKDKELEAVVKLMLQKLGRRVLEEKNIKIGFDGDMVDRIIQKGYNPTFGARSLNRYIEDKVEDLIAKKIIAGEVKEGEKIIVSL